MFIQVFFHILRYNLKTKVMKIGVDLEIRKNTIEGIEEAIRKYKNSLNKQELLTSEIENIRIFFDFDENEYYLQVRFKK